MKNNIFIFALMIGLLTGGFASAKNPNFMPTVEQEIVRTTDSIVINFGKKGSRIAIYVADAKDKEKLKNLDVNALLAKVQSKLDNIDPKSQETTITEGEMTLKIYQDKTEANENKQKIVVTDTTERKSKRNVNISWGWDKEKNRNYSKRNSRMVRSYFDFDLGLNTLLNNPNTSFTELSPIGSRYVAFGMGVRLKLSKTSPLRINTGVEVAWNNFMFENNNVRVDKNDTGILWGASPVSQSKSKLVAVYLNVPLTLSYRIPNTPFGFSAGAYVGYRLDSYNAYIESGRDKTQYHNSFFMNQMRYGIRTAVDFKYATLFCNYDLNPLFQSGKGMPDMQVISFGVKISGGSL
jgi:hypothetical protein